MMPLCSDVNFSIKYFASQYNCCVLALRPGMADSPPLMSLCSLCIAQWSQGRQVTAVNHGHNYVA